jgi:hypothetical protein
MFRPTPLSNEQLAALREAAQKKGSLLTGEERAVIIGAKPVTSRQSNAPAGHQYSGDPRV